MVGNEIDNPLYIHPSLGVDEAKIRPPNAELENSPDLLVPDPSSMSPHHGIHNTTIQSSAPGIP